MAKFRICSAGLFRGHPCSDLQDAVALACEIYDREALAVDDPEPRRELSERRMWLVYDESDYGEFAEREIYIVEIEK